VWEVGERARGRSRDWRCPGGARGWQIFMVLWWFKRNGGGISDRFQDEWNQLSGIDKA